MSIFKAAGILGASLAIALTIQHAASPGTREATDVSWPQAGPTLDQGATGACTGFAVAGLLGLGRADALRIYAGATKIDGVEGNTYPGRDTGSTLPAAMEEAQEIGLIDGYKMERTVDGALKALQRHPEAVSVHWPLPSDGHVLVLLARHGSTVTLQNSWGTSFGQGGRFTMLLDQFKKAFIESAYVS